MVELEQQLERTGILEDINMNPRSRNYQLQANLIPPLSKHGADLNEIFDYLDEVRDHGMINMYGAAPVVAEEFDLPSELCIEILYAWMQDDRH